jgi:hypothetical protein
MSSEPLRERLVGLRSAGALTLDDPCDPATEALIRTALDEASRWAGRVRTWFDTLLGRLRAAIRAADTRQVTVGRPIYDAFQLIDRHFGLERRLLSSFPWSPEVRFTGRQLRAAAHALWPIRRRYIDLDASVLSFGCIEECPRGRRGADVLGSADPGSNHFTVYRRCFVAQPDKTRAGVVLHEAFHARHRTFDHDTYSFERGYPGSRPLTNAESFATFAAHVATGSGYRIVALPEMRVLGTLPSE